MWYVRYTTRVSLEFSTHVLYREFFVFVFLVCIITRNDSLCYTHLTFCVANIGEVRHQIRPSNHGETDSRTLLWVMMLGTSVDLGNLLSHTVILVIFPTEICLLCYGCLKGKCSVLLRHMSRLSYETYIHFIHMSTFIYYSHLSV